jgi:hypothetical protein
MALVQYLEQKLMLYQRNGTSAMLVSGCRSPNALNLGIEVQVAISKPLDSMHHDTAANPRDGLLLVSLGDA